MVLFRRNAFENGAGLIQKSSKYGSSLNFRRRAFSTVRQYSSSNFNRFRGSFSSKPNDNNWRIAASTTVAIAGTVFLLSISKQQGKQSDKSKSVDKDTSKHDELTKQPGLQPNAERGREYQDASETTGANTRKGNTVQHYADSKAPGKKRINSEAGMKQGTADKAPAKGYEAVEDKAASSKPPGGRHTISGKQEGLSNSDTKYSIDLTNNPEKSQKGEGAPETSKLKGTVDVKRPLAP